MTKESHEADLDGNAVRSRPGGTCFVLIEQILVKDQVMSTRSRRACKKNFINIIMNPLHSTAGHTPHQLLVIPLDLQLLASSSRQPFCKIVTRPGLRTSYTTFKETRSPLQNSFTSVVVGPMAEMAI
jgi:hypothetical protein